jgi:hypothetical protein
MVDMKRKIAVVVAAVVFGILLSFRSSAPLTWQRVLLAGVAFIVLGLSIWYVRARRS